MKKLLCVVVLAASALTPIAAQAPPTSPSFQNPQAIQEATFRSGVDVVAVDVSVLDRNGRPVDDLQASEFVVRINGATRRVVSADFVKVDVGAARRLQAVPQGFYTTNLAPPNGRRIVIAIDQVRIGPGALRPVLDAASRFLDRLTPFDQVALVAFPEPGVRVDFTNDHVRLRRALQALIGHPQRSVTRRHNMTVSDALAIVQGQEKALADVVERECPGGGRERCHQEIDRESMEIVREVREDADASLRGLRELLEQLAKVDGQKVMILLSEGFLSDDGELRPLIALAGRARTSINALAVDLGQASDVTVRTLRPNDAQDRRLNVQTLERLAEMSRGALFRIASTGDAAFDRLAAEISGYYMLGVVQQPGDSAGDRHRIEVEVRRRDVTVRSRQAFVLSPTRLATIARDAPEAALRDTLLSPFGVSDLPLRVTTFTQLDPDSGNVRLVVAAQVGEAGTQSGPYTVGYIVLKESQVVASFLERVTLSPASNSPKEPLRFVSGVPVEPGTYSLRFAVIDADGRRGSVGRLFSAAKMADASFALSDLIVGPVPQQGKAVTMQVEPYVASGDLAAYLELYSTTDATWQGTTVEFEIAQTEDAPALASHDAFLEPGPRSTWRLATGVVPARLLPAGRYVARARITRGGKAVSVLVRPFVLEHATSAPATTSPGGFSPAVVLAAALPKFDRSVALDRNLVDAMLTMVAQRAPDLESALVAARAGQYDVAARAAFDSGNLVVGTFMRGLDLFQKGQLDAAVTQLQSAAGARREFFPAAFFLGASYAAVGRDQDAAGVWQLALGREPRPAIAYTVAADARLRTGQPQSAIDILKPAYDRDPAVDDIARRLAIAYALLDRHAEALTVFDGYLLRHPADQDILFAAITSQYELARGGQVLSNTDRDKVQRYAAAYQGPNRVIIDTYLQTMK